MSNLAIGMMVVICVVVWGGFAGSLVRAIRSERGKQPAREG